jgi:hypothetical protein
MHVVIRAAARPRVHRQIVLAFALASLGLHAAEAWARPAPGAPMRIVLLVDSSGTIAPHITLFRAGLREFIDALPGEPEIVFISTGGQLRVRIPPTTDREKLRHAVEHFNSDGGANAFVDALLEADKRFLRVVPERRPVFVIITTDSGQWRNEPRVNDYNRFMRDFHQRGGRAHGIVLRGTNTGMTSEILSNLTENTGGFFDALLVPNGLPGKIRALVDLLAADQ